jgi:UDP-N-acetylglucosamine:LPS N-acetylglucosamine transferase
MQNKDAPPLFVVFAGGGFGWETRNLLQRLAPTNRIVVLAPDPVSFPETDSLRIVRVPAITLIKGANLVRTTYRVLVSALLYLRLILEHRPRALICVGSSIAIPLFLAGGLLRRKRIFIESITRVTQMSQTARLIDRFSLCERLYVQWPETASLARKAIYRGSIL